MSKKYQRVDRDPNLRFTPGRIHLFVCIKFEASSPRFGGLYFPWTDKLISLEVLALTCKEHCKVGWDQEAGGEPKYDGFIFEDQQGRVWHNQYPKASYGQIDDSQNWIVRPGWETEGEDLYLYATEAEIYLERLQRGARDLNNELEMASALRHHSEEVLRGIVTHNHRVLINRSTSTLYYKDEKSENHGHLVIQENDKPMFEVEVFQLPSDKHPA